MKIQFNKMTAPLPDGTNKISDNVFLKETVTEDQRVKLNILFPAKDSADTFYNFEMIPDQSFGSLSDIINDLMRQLYTGDLEIPDDIKTDVMRSVTIGVGELAANGAPDENPENKIFYHMLNGSVVVTNANQIDWDSNIKNIEEINRTADNIRHLIASLISRKEIEVKTINDDGTESSETRDTVEVVKNEIENFTKRTNLNVDYSVFEKSGIATEREVLIAKLIDILEIHQQIIMVTVSIAAQRNMLEQFSKQNQNAEVPADDIPTIPEEEVETLAEVASENEG